MFMALDLINFVRSPHPFTVQLSTIVIFTGEILRLFPACVPPIVHLSVRRSVCLVVCPNVCLFVLSVCLSVCKSVIVLCVSLLSIRLILRPSIRPSVCLPAASMLLCLELGMGVESFFIASCFAILPCRRSVTGLTGLLY